MFIDLHSHTNASDGTLTPQELVSLAKQIDLAALAITDHDTFEGYERAVPFAQSAGLNLLRGIELNTRLYLNGPHFRFAHVLVYFPSAEPSRAFQDWLFEQRAERKARNEKLVSNLQNKGIDITLAEVEALGRSVAGRPHFARILVNKGYATSFEDAFRRYIGEDAPTYVERESKTTEEAIAMARQGGGIPSLAHPVRLGLTRDAEPAVFAELKKHGLLGLEVIHSEHPPALQKFYSDLAADLDLLPTGGSDFHGAAKPGVELGSGVRNNVRVPPAWLDALRRLPA